MSYLTKARERVTSHNLTQTGVLYRNTQTLGSYGETIQTPVVAGTLVCQIAKQMSAGSGVLDALEQIGEFNNYVLTVRHDADIRADDAIEIEGNLYTVMSLADDHNFRVARRAYVRRKN